MAEFKMALTDSGRAMFSDVQTGAVLVPTKIVIGSGEIPVGMTAATMTAVVKVEATLSPLNKCLRSNDGKVTFGAAFSNAEVHKSFAYRELALFCKAEYRDHSGLVTRTVPEVLYIYGNSGDSADQIPAGGAGEAVEKQIDIIAWIGNDTKVDLTISSGIYLTREQLDVALNDISSQVTDVEEGLSQHIRASNPHGISCQKINAVPTSRKINKKSLSGDVTLTSEDVGAAPATHSHNYAGASTPGGNALAAVKLAVSRLFSVNLDSTSAIYFDGSSDVPMGVRGTLPVKHGGTGATTASEAWSNIDAAPASHNHSASDITSGTLNSSRLPTVPINKGGTNATSADQALVNLGAAPKVHPHKASDITGLGIEYVEVKSQITLPKLSGNKIYIVHRTDLSKPLEVWAANGGRRGDFDSNTANMKIYTYDRNLRDEYYVLWGHTADYILDGIRHKERTAIDMIHHYTFRNYIDTNNPWQNETKVSSGGIIKTIDGKKPDEDGRIYLA